jgi:hypothetical protein
VKSSKFPQHVHGADWLRRVRGLQSHRAEAETTLMLNPAMGWSMALLVSLGLWWGLWLAVSSLASVLV